jgi:Lon protease-like protein
VNCRRIACIIPIAALLLEPGTGWTQSAGQNSARNAGVLPATIPIFPLQDVMLFPNVPRPLHIFEPRYRAMVADALKGDRIIGMVLLRPGWETDYEGRPPVYAIGCAGVITESNELSDGRYIIVLQGLVKFRIQSEDQSRPYRLARVEALPEPPNEKERAALRERRSRLMALLAASDVRGSAPPAPGLPDEDLVNALAQHLDLEPGDRQALLERNGALARSDQLIELLEAQVKPRQ